MKKIPTLKYIRSWNLCANPNLAITFWEILSMISFEDLILILFIWVPNVIIEGIMKKNPKLNNNLLVLLGVWPKKRGILYIGAFLFYFIFWYTWLCLLLWCFHMIRPLCVAFKLSYTASNLPTTLIKPNQTIKSIPSHEEFGATPQPNNPRLLCLVLWGGYIGWWHGRWTKWTNPN